MKGHHFETVYKAKDTRTKALKHILEKACRDAFDARKSRSKQSIDAGGAILEIFNIL